jgi:hypothetical protein
MSTVQKQSTRLSKNEEMSILQSMGDDTVLRSKYLPAHQLFGPGIWILQAKSSSSLKSMKPSRAIYVPLSSVDMFFTDDKLVNSKIDPNTSMLVGIIYGVPEENVSPYACACIKITPPQPPKTTNTKKNRIVPFGAK